METQGGLVVHTKTEGQIPKATVYSGTLSGGAPSRPLTPAEAKRSRYLYNLKQSFSHLKEHLQAVEYFARVNGVPPSRLQEIKEVHTRVLEDLSQKFQEKISAYDQRIRKEKG